MTELNEILAAQAAQEEQIKSIAADCTDIKHCLLGNGKPGLVIRTDRLEQKDQFKTKLFWVVTGAVVVLAVKTVGVDIVGAIVRAGN